MKPATELIHHGDGVSHDVEPLTTPIYETTTFLFRNAEEVRAYNQGKSSKYLYSRYANPTIVPVEEKIAALEGAESALVLSSGQAATATALMALVASGDQVVCSSAIYGGTFHLLADLLTKFGIRPRFVSLEQLARPESIISEATKLVWFETPINPTMRCVDIAKVAAACKAHGVISVVDNTFASPINQQPLALGVDLVMHSATKYLNGHSDVTAGALAGPARLIDRILDARKKVGTVLDPYAAYALGRGLKTLVVRMDRHNTNAMKVATWLASDKRVQTVYYPGLPQHPDHEIARKQMTGFGGMVCVDLHGGYEGAAARGNRPSARV